MGSHLDCSDWDYETHPEHKKLRKACDRLTGMAKKWPRKFDRFGVDTRPGHRLLFKRFAPPACSCFAGTYRGSKTCPALEHYFCGVRGTSVGMPPAYVEACMAMLNTRCQNLLDMYAASVRVGTVSPAASFGMLIDVLCDILEGFFTVHPFANGNGHAGRMLVWVLLARHGFAPKSWSIDAKQPYAKALDLYRAGNHAPLRLFLTRLAR